jgi:homoserine kinase
LSGRWERRAVVSTRTDARPSPPIDTTVGGFFFDRGSKHGDVRTRDRGTGIDQQPRPGVRRPVGRRRPLRPRPRPRVRPSAPGKLETRFPDQAPPGENRIATAFARACDRFGGAAPGALIEARSDIPITAGLGSSAAAAVAGLLLYGHLTAPREQADVLAVATELEGHPDNASAALLGGLTVSCVRDDGRIVARAGRWPDALRFVVATPAATLETKRSRAALPASVPLADAVFNLQRALLLLRALESGRFDDIREALRDRWHQPARSPLVPALAEALAIDHPAVLGTCLSGAGSSVVAIATAGRAREAAAELSAVYQRLQIPHTVRILCAHQPAGARTLEHTT